MSVPTASSVSVVDSLFSAQVANVVTAIMTAVFLFSFIIRAVEYRYAAKDDPTTVNTLENAAYTSYVTATTGAFCEVMAVSSMGRMLMVVWVTFGIIAGIALSSVVSSSLVLNGLADIDISSLAQLDPSQVCIDKSDLLLIHYLSTAFGIPVGAGSTLGAVTLASSADCFDALATNTVIKAVIAEKTVLDWVSVNLYATSGFFVSDVIYKQVRNHRHMHGHCPCD
jgi:hypothetical protein